MKLVVFFFLGIWFFSTPSRANTIYVDANASGTEDGTQDHPYSNFKDALNDPSLTSGDAIAAAPGTYSGDDNTNLEVNPSLSLVFMVNGNDEVLIDLGNKDVGFLKVTSTGLPFDVDGYTFKNQADNSKNPVLSFDSTEATTVSACYFKNIGFAVSMINVQAMTVQGSTFEHCHSKDQDGPCLFCQDTAGSIVTSHFEDSRGKKGGAIYIDDTPKGSAVKLLFVNFIGNEAEKQGGGLYVALGNVSVVSSTFTNNSASGDDDGSGGGLYSEVPITLTAVVFEYNTATKEGGGIALESTPSSSSSQLASSSFQSLQVNDNMAPVGGGIHISSLSPVFISNSKIIGNFAYDEDKGKGGGLYIDDSSDIVTIDDTTIAQNSAAEKGGGIYINGPSSSALIQVRSGCIIEKNTAVKSGGGVELAGPVIYAGFSGSTIDYNIVTADDGVGGGLLLKGSAVVSDCLLEGNVAEYGGGVEIDQSGLITFVDNTFTLNNATKNGGGMRITTSSGVLVKGGDFTGNNGAEGAGVYIGPSLPVEFASVAFSDNSASKSGGAIYLSGSSQESIAGVNLVKIRNCDLFDTFNEAIYSANGGELVLDETCTVPGLHLSDSSVSLCGCSVQEASITNLYLDANQGSFLTDSSIQLNGNFNWRAGEIYGVDSKTCETGLKTGFNGTDYSIDSPPTLTILGTGLVGTGSDTLNSREIDWAITSSINLATDLLDLGDGTITVDGRFTLTESQSVQCGTMYNYGTLQMEQGSVIDGTLVQKGTMEIRYSSVPDEDTVLASVGTNDIEGGKIVVYAPSPTPLSEGDSFAVLEWAHHSGTYGSLDLHSNLDDDTKGTLTYLTNALKVNIVHGGGGTGAGAIVGIVFGVLIFLALVTAGGFYYARQRARNSYGELDESSQGFGEGIKVLGGESAPVEGGEQQSG